MSRRVREGVLRADPIMKLIEDHKGGVQIGKLVLIL